MGKDPRERGMSWPKSSGKPCLGVQTTGRPWDPCLTRALPDGATPRPAEPLRPGTRFLPGAEPGGHGPSAIKFKEVRETLRRNLSIVGK